MIANTDFMCFVCRSMTFEGEQAFVVDHNVHGVIHLCIVCGVAAEKLGWIVK